MWINADVQPPHDGPWILKSKEGETIEVGIAFVEVVDGKPEWTWENGICPEEPLRYCPIPDDEEGVSRDPRDRKPGFLMGKGDDGRAILVVGVPEIAYQTVARGEGFDFDFRGAGLNLTLFIFKATDHADVMRQLEGMAKVSGTVLDDRRRQDFSVKR